MKFTAEEKRKFIGLVCDSLLKEWAVEMNKLFIKGQTHDMVDLANLVSRIKNESNSLIGLTDSPEKYVGSIELSTVTFNGLWEIHKEFKHHGMGETFAKFVYKAFLDHDGNPIGFKKRSDTVALAAALKIALAKLGYKVNLQVEAGILEKGDLETLEKDQEVLATLMLNFLHRKVEKAYNDSRESFNE